MATNGNDRSSGLLARVFELRTIIAVLFGVFGIVCVIWGAAFTTAEELRKAAGVNVNLVAGIGMLVAAAAFLAWALLAPVEQEQRRATQREQTTADDDRL